MDGNFDNIFNELTPVTKNNRYAKQECDLLFDPEKGANGKFVVSESLYRSLDLNNHGFLALTGKGRVFVGIVPNENAVTYAGRTDSESKSDEFTSTEFRDRLTDVGMDGNEFWLSFAGTKDDIDYFEVVDYDPSKAEQQDELLAEDRPVETETATLEQDHV